MSLPVLSVAQMREWEKATWASGQTEEAVMRRVGQIIARRAEELTPPGGLILVFSGKGHNGDDARFAAEAIAGRELQVFRVTDPELVTREATPFLERPPALIIDGLFGSGLNRPLGDAWIRLIQRINQSHAPILAVDVPSGLSGDTGEPLPDAIRATVTLSLGAVKQGMIKPSSSAFVGRLETAPEIGLIPYPFTTEISMITPEDFSGFPPSRPLGGHKGTFGHLSIVAGTLGYHGAAVLAARGAQRAQPGLITLFTAETVYHPVAAQLQSAMVKPWAASLDLPAHSTALLVGPGLAAPDLPEPVKEFTRQRWERSPLAMIVDASALAWLPEGECPLAAFRLITPHPGEAARMLGISASEVQANRPRAVRELSRRWGNCWVILKGHQTMVGQARADLFVNPSGNPYLAQGGSGDLLAGYLGGLMAQPALQRDPITTLCYAVWEHGAAADALQTSRSNWTVEDLAEVLGNVRKGGGSGGSSGTWHGGDGRADRPFPI